MLATRGWGVEEFRLATPMFLAACRWVVMTEKAIPEYRQAQAIADTPAKDLSNPMAKLQASTQLAEWEPWLFPVDDDG